MLFGITKPFLGFLLKKPNPVFFSTKKSLGQTELSLLKTIVLNGPQKWLKKLSSQPKKGGSNCPKKVIFSQSTARKFSGNGTLNYSSQNSQWDFCWVVKFPKPWYQYENTYPHRNGYCCPQRAWFERERESFEIWDWVWRTKALLLPSPCFYLHCQIVVYCQVISNSFHPNTISKF